MDENYRVPIELIAVAGDARSEAMHGIQLAKKGELEEARLVIKNAEERLLQAHQLQTDLIQQEASGNKVDVNIILVHSQDHLTSAILTIDLAKEMVDLYDTIRALKGV